MWRCQTIAAGGFTLTCFTQHVLTCRHAAVYIAYVLMNTAVTVCATQANWLVASGALAADAAALRPAVDQSYSDARLHDVQRLPVSGRDDRRCSGILLFRLDSSPRTTLRLRPLPLMTDSTSVEESACSLPMTNLKRVWHLLTVTL